MGGGESPGVWYENAAARGFGVRGEVIKDDIERLFDGYHPGTGEALAQNHGKADRRAAIDLCLSVPKDVSALWAVSDALERRQIEAAFGRAVDETLRYVSDEFGASRRGQGGYDREHVDLLVAIFTHRQSRGPDPQIHAHCLVLNTARRADGSPGTIDAGPLLQAKKIIGAYFRSALANELGITLEADQKFSFRVAGVPEALSEHWSSRANEIEAEARARGVDGGAAKAYVAIETRRAKDERPLAEVKEEWRETARQYVFDAHDVQQIFGRPRAALTPSRVVETIDQALQVAVERLTSEQAHFTKADLTRAVLIATAPQGIAPREVLKRVEETLGHERFINLGDRRFTTKEIYHGIERAALDAAKRLGYQHPSRTVSERRVEKAIAQEPRLNGDQREAVKMVCQGADLTLIQGGPGSGKSMLFSVARHAIEKDGGNVMGLTPSNRAARELEKSAGVKSYTIDRFLFDREHTALDAAKHHAKILVRTAFGLPTWKPPKLDVNRRTTIIIDECAMCNSDKLSRAIRHAEKAGCRVVLVSDHRQLPAIGQGGLFRELWEQARDDQKTELTDIMRQRQEWARKAIRQVGQGEAQAALATYKEWGQLHVLPTGDLAERELVEGWMRAGIANPRDNLILAATNADVARLNGKAQACRWEAGQLGYRSVEVGEERIHEGDRILFTDTKKCLGLVKSEFGTVTRIERLSQRLTVQIDGQDELVRFSLREFASLRLGYAATVHRAQGMTLEQDAYVLVGGSMQSREMTYVQISRAGGETHLFCDEQTAGRDESELTRMVGRCEEKFSAHAMEQDDLRGHGERRPEQDAGLHLSIG